MRHPRACSRASGGASTSASATAIATVAIGEKTAIATVAIGEKSAAGAIVLGASLWRVGSASRWLALADGISNRTAAALTTVGWTVHPAPAWTWPVGWTVAANGVPCAARWSASAQRAFMAKLALFSFTWLRSIVLLDSDTVLFANPDHLHAIDPRVPAAAAHRTLECPQLLCSRSAVGTNPNAGVVLIRPSAVEWAGLRTLVGKLTRCPKYPEQGVMQMHFGTRLRWFDRWWNAREGPGAAGAGSHGSASMRQKLRVYHFVGKCPKPLAYACRWHELPAASCERGRLAFAYERWRRDWRRALARLSPTHRASKPAALPGPFGCEQHAAHHQRASVTRR